MKAYMDLGKCRQFFPVGINDSERPEFPTIGGKSMKPKAASVGCGISLRVMQIPTAPLTD
jgi:hypothetical protein